MIRADMHNKAIQDPDVLRELAHELRSPLGGLEAMADLLARTPLTPDQARMIAAMQAAASHLRSIADRILTAGGAATHAGPVHALKLIESLALAAAARARSKGLSFRLDIEGDAAGEQGLHLLAIPEPVSFRQVIENLIDNAIRASESGTLALAFGVAGSPEDNDSRPEGRRLTVSLSDEGRGLSEADARRLIMDGGSIPGVEGGAGLGLALSGRLVASCGGVLAGGPGVGGTGARFTFDWPLATAESRTEKPAFASSNDGIDAISAPTEPSASQSAEVLVVDDHPASRLVLTTILRAFGFGTCEAGSVAEAQDLLSRRPIRAVFTDLCLGEDDGRDLIRMIGATDVPNRPRLVVISADALDDGSDCAAFVDAAIVKPVSVQAIADAVRIIGITRTDVAGDANAA